MKLKKYSEYGIRLLIAISNLNTSVEIDELLNFLKIPKISGTKVLNQLKANKLISDNSLSLKRKKEDITILDIIECFEEIEISHCIKFPNTCEYKYGNCSICMFFFDLRDSIKQTLSKKTLAELCSNQKEIDSHLE